MHRKFEINNFDLLRLLAATQVLIIHATNHLDLPWSYWVIILGMFPGICFLCNKRVFNIPFIRKKLWY